MADRNGYLVGEAAAAASRLGLRELVPELTVASARLLEDPLNNDKGCSGKNRIIEALLAFDAHEPDTYLAGVRHVQLEPARRRATARRDRAPHEGSAPRSDAPRSEGG
ncbi:hypothetical protein [Sorangium sp. So ce1078]|uniref:hypothetical protein n=1 Tax=Sorangium sp. So ce1078 TaxID=3133329 RepID=UPI003F625ED7